MKYRLAMLTVSLLVGIAMISNTRIVIEKEGGGPTGWDEVREVHDGDYHYLGCFDEGWAACAWTTPPDQHRGFPALIDYAESQIAQGQLSGTYSEVIDSVRCFVQWTATDIYNLRIELWAEQEQ